MVLRNILEDKSKGVVAYKKDPLKLNLQFFAEGDPDLDNENEFNESFSGLLEKFGHDKLYEAFKEDQEGFKRVQSDMDTHATKQLDSWQKKHLDSIKSEAAKEKELEVLKAHGLMKDSEAELRDQVQKLTNERVIDKQKFDLTKEFSEKNIPLDLVNFVVDLDEVKLNEKKTLIESVVKSIRDSSEEEFLKKYTRKVDKHEDEIDFEGKNVEDMTEEEFRKYREYQKNNRIY